MSLRSVRIGLRLGVAIASLTGAIRARSDALSADLGEEA